MFARVFALLPLALLASAAHLAVRGDGQENSCNGGTQACCSQAFNQNIPSTSGLNVVSAILNAAAQAGVTCTGIAVTTCNQQSVCCDHNDDDGDVLSVSCNNINGL